MFHFLPNATHTKKVKNVLFKLITYVYRNTVIAVMELAWSVYFFNKNFRSCISAGNQTKLLD